MGKTSGHHWGDSTTAYGENLMAAVTHARSSSVALVSVGADRTLA